MGCMKRLEIIGNRAIQEDLFEHLKNENIEIHYTLIPVVHGVGTSDPKFGDNVWPEENFLLIIYCEDIIAEKILQVVKKVKEIFPKEGLKLFEITVECSV